MLLFANLKCKENSLKNKVSNILDFNFNFILDRKKRLTSLLKTTTWVTVLVSVMVVVVGGSCPLTIPMNKASNDTHKTMNLKSIIIITKLAVGQ